MVIDLTGIATSILAGFFGVLAVAVPSLVDRHFRLQAARDVLRRSIANSVGAMQQSGTSAGIALLPRPAITGVPERLLPAVNYVLDNAGAEADMLNVTPEQIAAKVLAQVGLVEIRTNQAVASNATPLVPAPLGPVPTIATTPGVGGNRA